MTAIEPSAPRLAATVLLLRDDPFEVLMVRRRAGGTFPDALVFPGGCVDPGDGDPAWAALIDGEPDAAERSLRIAACRETYEEVGVLIGATPPQPIAGEAFAATVTRSGGRLAPAALVHYAHWITPEGAHKRFDTHFYLCAMPRDQHPVADGRETVSLTWCRVGDDATDPADDAVLHFPTRLNLRRLAESASAAEAMAAARIRPRFTVAPVWDADTATVTIPAEAGYGITEDRR